MKKLFSLLGATLVSTVLFAQTTLKADKMHSKLTFAVTHLSVSDVAGLFKNFEATVTSSRPDFSDGVFELTADIASINTEVEMRDNHLKSADFFDVEKFPKLNFKSTGIENTGKGTYKLTGDLTIHGVTKTVALNLWFRGTIENPMSKAATSGFQVTGTIKRSDFNLGAKFPNAIISDEVRIKADGEFAK